MREDFYQLLGVTRHASRQTLKRAFHDRLKDVHPDHNPDDALACERTRELVEAYKTLSNPLSRRRYDASLIPAPIIVYPPHKPPPSPLLPIISTLLPPLVYIAVGLGTAALAIAIADHIP